MFVIQRIKTCVYRSSASELRGWVLLWRPKVTLAPLGVTEAQELWAVACPGEHDGQVWTPGFKASQHESSSHTPNIL